MPSRKVTLKVISYAGVIALVFFSTLACAESTLGNHAQVTSLATSVPPIANAEKLSPPPASLTDLRAQVNLTALSPTLSYYFISGNTFTPYSGTATPYFRQADGCVNQMPIGHPFAAPVHLPQGSQVVSITLYTGNSVGSATNSVAYFILSDGKGNAGYTVSAVSQDIITGYQQNTSSQNNPANIDNQTYSYFVQWVTQGGPSPTLSLCGVRVAYYAPLGATYLPFIAK